LIGLAVACYPGALLPDRPNSRVRFDFVHGPPAFASVQDIGAASAECFHDVQDLDVNYLTDV